MNSEKHLFRKFGRIVPAGTILFEEGQPCAGMYIIQKGRVRLYKRAGGEDVTIDILEPGDFFGEMACLLGQPRSINAVAEEDSEVLLIQPEVLDGLFRERNGLGLKVLGNLASRLKKAYGIIERLVEERGSSAKREDPSL